MSNTAKSPPSAIGALPPGTRLGEFEIRQLLGVGGFGMVYLAFDHALEREVAVKEYMPASMAGRTETLHVSLRTQDDAEVFTLGLRSFVNEARLLARFDHPSLLKVHRFWEANNTAYMAMPVLRGQTLRDIRKSGQPTIDEAWLRSKLKPLLGALEVLHAEGVYHRDIAPDNILVEADGHPVLLDFGAARRVIGDKTQSLTAILKPAYAPIEQYGESGAVKQGPWTDLYALGGTLHFMLMGQAPAPATVRAVTDESAGLADQVLPGCSAEFLAIIDWMLASRPADRPQSVAQLRAVLEGQAPLPHRPRPPVAALPLADTDPDATVVRSPTVALAFTATGAASPTVTGSPTTAGARAPVSTPTPDPTTDQPAPKRATAGALATAGILAVVLAGAGVWALLKPAPEDSRAAAPPLPASAPAPVASAAVPAVVETPPASSIGAASTPGPSLTDTSTGSAAAGGPAAAPTLGTTPATTPTIAPPAATSTFPAGPAMTAAPSAPTQPMPAVVAPLPRPGTATPPAQARLPDPASIARPPPARTTAATTPPVATTVAPPPSMASPAAQRPPPPGAELADGTRPAVEAPAKPARPAQASAPGSVNAGNDTPAAPTAILTPEARCSGKSGLTRFVCMEDECLRSRSKGHPECLAWRSQSRPAHAQP